MGGNVIGGRLRPVGHESVDCSQSLASSSSMGKQQQQQNYIRTSAIKLLDSFQFNQQQQRQGGVKRKHETVNEVQVR